MVMPDELTQPAPPERETANTAMPLPSMDFIYKLNAMERAALDRCPANVGYGDARAAVLQYVAARERALLAAEREREELATALRDLMEMIEGGQLVRNTLGDGEPGWAVRQLPLVKKLQAANSLLSRLRHPSAAGRGER